MTAGPSTLPALQVGVLRESSAGERRVALTPDGVTRLRALGLAVAVQSGAGAGAAYPDADYLAVGATVVTCEQLYADCDIVLCVQAPDASERAALRAGQTVVGLLQPRTNPDLVRTLADTRVTALSLDGLPRTLSRAQSMDALTSQANVAGYKAALVAANAYGSYFPMLMTAAGTVRPARMLVLGAGVAGLQAIGTARRLGAVVTAFDVRPAARSDIASTGASFLQLGSRVSEPAAGSSDGYARAQSASEQQDQIAALTEVIGSFDVVITTAQVPGRRPPLLVSSDAVARMGPGSVIVDLGASPLGGNVEGSVNDDTVVTSNGVTIIGAGHLPASVPRAASTAYSRNIAALLAHLVFDGALRLDMSDPITAGVLVTGSGPTSGPAATGAAGDHARTPDPQLTPTG